MSDELPLAEDLLVGAPMIARFIGYTPAQVYHVYLKNELPIFKLNTRLHARKSTLRRAIADMESKLVAAE